MITDKKTTGIPNRGAFSRSQGGAEGGTRGRIQLVKPNQVNNVGRSGPNKINTTALGGTAPSRPSASAPTPINPVQPRTQMVAPSPTTSAATSSTPQPITPTPELAPRVPAYQRQAKSFYNAPTLPQTPTGMDQARSAIRGLTSAQIGELLNELASGSLRGI